MGGWLCRRLMQCVGLVIVSAGPAAGVAHGAGFALMEQGVKSLGSAFSGGAAAAEDATTVFYNPGRVDSAQGTAGGGGSPCHQNQFPVRQ